MKATEIEWDVTLEEVIEDIIDYFDELTYSEAAEILDIPKDRYANMSTSERHDYIYDCYKHSQTMLFEFFNLPKEVDIPEGIEEEDVVDYLTEAYGFCVVNFMIEDEDE